MDKKQRADDNKALAKHLSITSSFEKKLVALKPLLRGQVVCCRRLSAMDEDAVQRRLCLGSSVIDKFYLSLLIFNVKSKRP